MNIGIYSGSFNPIHAGHIMLANYITEFTPIDEVWFLVTPQNPLKENKELLNEESRLDMVKIALKDYEKLKFSDFEFTLARPSYTVKTLREIKKKYKEHTFNLIIGSDNWLSFNKWKDHESIINEFNIYVYPRLNYPITISPKEMNRVTALNSPIIEISSTFIRNSIRENKNIKAFLPKTVYDFILTKNLYL